jgi:hypothetical protein
MPSLDMIEENDQKAELILVRVCADLPSRQARKAFCESVGVEWEEYQRLKRKYSRILERYKQQKEV